MLIKYKVYISYIYSNYIMKYPTYGSIYILIDFLFMPPGQLDLIWELKLISSFISI